MIVQCELLTKGDFKAAGYWPSSVLIFFLTETKSRPIKNAPYIKRARKQGERSF